MKTYEKVKNAGNKFYDGLKRVLTADINPKGLVGLIATTTIATTTMTGCALHYQNTEMARETDTNVKMYSGTTLRPRIIDKKTYCIKTAPEGKAAEVLGKKMDILNDAYLIPINNCSTTEILTLETAKITNKNIQYFLVPVTENKSGNLEIDLEGDHDPSDMVIGEIKNICLNQIAKYQNKSPFVSQRDIEKQIRNFPELNHGNENFKVIRMKKGYLTNADKTSLGFNNTNTYQDGKSILPLIFLQGEITPQLEIRHKNNTQKVDLTERIIGKQFLLMKGRLIDKPQPFIIPSAKSH